MTGPSTGSGGAARFRAAAEAAGVELETRSYPEGTRTATDAAAAIGCDVAQIVKSLVWSADGRGAVVLVSGADRAHAAAIARELGALEARPANAEEARAWTGYAIGGVPPFGHATELRVLMDEGLLAHETVWAAAGTPRDVFPIAPRALAEAAGARIVRVAA